MSLFLIILAAGNSTRLKSNIPKPYILVKNHTILEHSIKAFSSFKEIKKTIIVYNKKHEKYLKKLHLINTLCITGGKSRQESTLKALNKIKNMKCDKVIIHDSARPNPSRKISSSIIRLLKKNDAVTPVLEVTDATKRVKKNSIFKNIRRNSLRFSQTPQGFKYKKIYKKHLKNINASFDDDASLFTNDHEKVTTIKGSKKNIKITNNEDLDIYKALKKGKIFSGIGFDIHRLCKNRKLYLGGIKIPFALGLKGHSDADPVLHALIDALLGASKMGDIGNLFPNKNKKYKNIRSTKLLKKIIKLIRSRKFSINNIDINIIAQRPKIKKYTKKMIITISKICKIKSNQINIKGRTTEKLGIIGKEKAIASEVIVTLSSND